MIYRASPGTQFGVRARFCEPHTFRRFRGRAIAFSAAAYDQITRVPHPLCLPGNGNAIVRDSEGCDGAWTRRPFKDVYMYICTCIYPYGNFHTPSKLLLDRRQQIVINTHYLPLEMERRVDWIISHRYRVGVVSRGLEIERDVDSST